MFELIPSEVNTNKNEGKSSHGERKQKKIKKDDTKRNVK